MPLPAKGPADSTWSIPIAVPEVSLSKMTWLETIIEVFRRFLAPTTSKAFTTKNHYFLTESGLEAEVREYKNMRKQVKHLFLLSRSLRLAELRRIYAELNLESPPAGTSAQLEWDNGVDVWRLVTPKEKENSPEDTAKYTVLRVNPAMPAGMSSRATSSTTTPKAPSSTDWDSQSNHERVRELLAGYCTSVKQTQTLRSHLQDVEADVANYARLIETQATAELTHFRGFRDWCRVMLQVTGTFSNALIAVSTLGAGLVYSTVFGATRGDVDLMCYCFPFFCCGFLLPAIIQIILSWGASFTREARFASQRFWTIVVGVFLFLSGLSVMASIMILNITVFLLKTDSSTGSDPLGEPAPASAPGIIAFSISGTVFFMLMTATLVTAIVGKAFTTLAGIRALISATYGAGEGRDALKLWVPV